MTAIDNSNSVPTHIPRLIGQPHGSTQIDESGAPLSPSRPTNGDIYAQPFDLPHPPQIPQLPRNPKTIFPTTRERKAPRLPMGGIHPKDFERYRLLFDVMAGRSSLVEVSTPDPFRKTYYVSKLLGIVAATAALMGASAFYLASPVASLAFWTLPFLALGISNRITQKSIAGRQLLGSASNIAQNVANAAISGIEASVSASHIRREKSHLPDSLTLTILMGEKKRDAIAYLKTHSSFEERASQADSSISMLTLIRFLKGANVKIDNTYVARRSITSIRRHFFPHVKNLGELRSQISVADYNLTDLHNTASLSTDLNVANRRNFIATIGEIVAALSEIARGDKADSCLFA
jgi:hypothetical protein